MPELPREHARLIALPGAPRPWRLRLDDPRLERVLRRLAATLPPAHVPGRARIRPPLRLGA